MMQIFFKEYAGTFFICFVTNCYCVITKRYCLIIQYISPHSCIFRRADHPTIIGVDVHIGAVHQHKVSKINDHTCTNSSFLFNMKFCFLFCFMCCK